MVRAPFQVLVLPWRRAEDGELEFAILHRADEDVWQGIAGGGEDDETPVQAASREAFEECGLAPESVLLPLDTMASVPVIAFRDSHLWGDDRYVVTEHAFGVDATGQEITLSHEHGSCRWLPFDEAHQLLTYDSNRTALWELRQRLLGRGPRG